jgi:hypothetical protein
MKGIRINFFGDVKRMKDIRINFFGDVKRMKTIRYESFLMTSYHRHKKIHRLPICMAGVLFWLNSYVASHHLPVTPQSGQKDLFYCTV